VLTANPAARELIDIPAQAAAPMIHPTCRS